MVLTPAAHLFSPHQFHLPESSIVENLSTSTAYLLLVPPKPEAVRVPEEEDEPPAGVGLLSV